MCEKKLWLKPAQPNYPAAVIGTFLNAAGIIIGGIVGLTGRTALSPVNEAFAKVALAALIVFYGLRLTWASLNGPLPHLLRELLIIILAMMLGKLAGRLLRLQHASNSLGRWARERLGAVKPGAKAPADEGFRVCAALFCAAPLGILGALQEGLTSPPYFYPLGVKALIDGLAALGFASVFGTGVVLAALPVLAFQGTITLAARLIEPFLVAHDLVNSVNGVGGLLVFSVALVMLGLKRIEITDYLPSLAIAPLLTWAVG